MRSIVEFASSEDAKRAKEELADKPFMGRSVFIREVSRCDTVIVAVVANLESGP